MSDISTLWDTVRGDWSLRGADLVSGNDIVTAVLISLFTDREANPDDVIPDGTTDPRGWWGDDATVPIGSRIWLIDRAKKTQQTLTLAQDYITEALQWLIDDGVATRVDIHVEWTRAHTLGAQVTVYRAGDPAPIKIATPDVFLIPRVEAWGWSDDQGLGEWEPLAIATLPVPPAPTYFTSILYPFEVQDTLSIGVPPIERGYLIGGVDTLSLTVPGIVGGSLVATEESITYDGTPHPDTLSLAVPQIVNGTLVVTEIDIVYDGTPHPDTLSLPIATITGGTLVVTIAYITYVNAETYVDTLSLGVPAITGGSLA